MRREPADGVQRDLETARRIVREFLPTAQARLFLFGSRARGDAGPHADIDVAVLPAHPLPADLLARVRDAFEESTIPFRVDLLDLSTVDEDLRGAVLAEAIPWTD